MIDLNGSLLHVYDKQTGFWSHLQDEEPDKVTQEGMFVTQMYQSIIRLYTAILQTKILDILGEIIFTLIMCNIYNDVDLHCS